jgi:hypothetical protein
VPFKFNLRRYTTVTVVLLMEEAGERWDELAAAMKAVATEVRAGEEERGEDSRSVLFMVGGLCTRCIQFDPQLETTW